MEKGADATTAKETLNNLGGLIDETLTSLDKNLKDTVADNDVYKEARVGFDLMQKQLATEADIFESLDPAELVEKSIHNITQDRFIINSLTNKVDDYQNIGVITESQPLNFSKLPKGAEGIKQIQSTIGKMQQEVDRNLKDLNKKTEAADYNIWQMSSAQDSISTQKQGLGSIKSVVEKKLNGAAEDIKQTTTEANGLTTKQKWMVAGAALAAAVVIGGGVYLYRKNQENQNATPTNNNVAMQDASADRLQEPLRELGA